MSIKFDLDDLKISGKFLDSPELEQFAIEQLSITNDRLHNNLEQGLDSEGKSLPDYSDSYKNQILKRKVRGKVNPELVNLTSTGELSGSRNISRIDNGAELRIEGTRNITIATALLKKFKNWFSFSAQDIARIEKAGLEALEKSLEQATKK